MRKFLTIMAVLAAVATPALAQSSANRNAVVKHRTQIERSVPTQVQSDFPTSPTVGDR
jgi:hypothetical protein